MLYNDNEIQIIGNPMTIALQKVLPIKLPIKNTVFMGILEPIGFKDIGTSIGNNDIENYLSNLPSLTTITHAIAKSIPVFTQKNMVVIAQIRKNTYQGKKMQSLFLTFNYDTLFYGHLNRQGFEGIFYDKTTKAVGIDVQSEDALIWINENLKDYFQVVINLTTHEYLYQEVKPRLREVFVPASTKIPPVTLWLNQLIETMKAVNTKMTGIEKLELHNGDRFALMPNNFFLVCYVDKLLLKLTDKKGWTISYMVLDIMNPSNNKLYIGVKNKDITMIISKYMDACNYHKSSPYTVKESKSSN